MNVTIQLIGTFQIGRFEEAIREYPSGSCVRNVLDKLMIPDPLLGAVLVNGIHAGSEELLNDGDAVCIMPFIDGG